MTDQLRRDCETVKTGKNLDELLPAMTAIEVGVSIDTCKSAGAFNAARALSSYISRLEAQLDAAKRLADFVFRVIDPPDDVRELRLAARRILGDTTDEAWPKNGAHSFDADAKLLANHYLKLTEPSDAILRPTREATMKAEPLKLTDDGYVRCEPAQATHLRLHLPGPLPNRILPVMIGGRREGTPNWTWNGSVDKPTVKPSVLTRGGDVDGEHVCHSWINDGRVQFLYDCSHEFAGQTLDLLEVD